MTKRKARHLLLAGVSALLLHAGAPLHAAEGPRAVVRSSTHEFGKVRKGQLVRHIFEIRNDGDAPLRIERIVSGCGCTTSEPPAAEIAPGTKAPISVQFDTTGFFGEKRKSVRVFTNDPKNPSLVLTLAGTVEGDLQVIPKRLVFDRVVAGSSAEVAEEVTITTKTAADAQNLTVRSPSEQVIIRPLGGGETYRKFAVSLAKDVPPGEVRERLLVTIPGTLEAPVNLPVFASVVPPVKVSPTTLSFGVIDGKSPLTRSVRIDNLNDEPLVIDGVESTHEAVTATIHERVNGKRYTLKVVIDPHKVTSNVEATLNIRASGSRDPLAIKVLGETPPRNY